MASKGNHRHALWLPLNQPMAKKGKTNLDLARFDSLDSKTEDVLIQGEEFHLLGMKQLHQGEELALSVMVVDVTEQGIERPKKNNDATTQGRKSTIH